MLLADLNDFFQIQNKSTASLQVQTRGFSSLAAVAESSVNNKTLCLTHPPRLISLTTERSQQSKKEENPSLSSLGVYEYLLYIIN